MDGYKIINDSCIEALKQLDKNSIDLIFADPPYWMRTSGVLKRVEGTNYNGCSDDWDNQFRTLQEYESFTRQWLTQCYDVLKDDGAIWVIGSMQCIYTIGSIMQELGFWIINDVIWQKANPTPNFMGSRLNNSHETLIWATKSQKSRYTFHYKTAKELNCDIIDYDKGVRKQLGSVWKFPVCSGNERLKDDNGNKLHSTQKPFALLYRIINISSNIGDMVLDPFGGTFTTGEVALQCGRNFIGIDASKKYCEYGKRRLDKVVQSIGDIERATFDIKPQKVDFIDLIKERYLSPDEKLFLKDKTTFAVLQSNGKVFLPEQNIVTDIHTGAARLSNKKALRVNGFDFWYVLRNNKLISIKDIRENYRKAISKK